MNEPAKGDMLATTLEKRASNTTGWDSRLGTTLEQTVNNKK